MSPNRAPLEDQAEDELAWLRRQYHEQKNEIGTVRELLREQVALTARMARYLGGHDGE